LISLTSILTLIPVFLESIVVILSRFSPVLPRIRDDLAVKIVTLKLSVSLETIISHTGIHFNSFLRIHLTFKSTDKSLLYDFLSEYQVEYQFLIYGILNDTGLTLCHIFK